ncbi:MAG: NAD(P)-dependent oxidoreductase [Arenicellales bacterium]
MRVFVAGATGALGAPLLPLLVDAGHEVVGMTRTPAKAGDIEGLGASAAVADGLDADAVGMAVRAAKPDVIVHQMTALSGKMDARRFDRTFARSNRLRTEGLDHLLAAGREVGVRRIVVQSFCGWPYARRGGFVKSEEDALDTDPPKLLRRTLEAIRYLEHAVTTSSVIEGLVLRYGAFYGPDTGMLAEPVLAQLRRRWFPLIGDGDGWWSFLHVRDAATATAIAVERGAPGIYNIVDDDPAPVREWLPALAETAGGRPPVRLPEWLARLATGEHMVEMMTRGRAGSNAKAKRELRWQPAYPSWRRGFPAVLVESDPEIHIRTAEPFAGRAA